MPLKAKRCSGRTPHLCWSEFRHASLLVRLQAARRSGRDTKRVLRVPSSKSQMRSEAWPSPKTSRERLAVCCQTSSTKAVRSISRSRPGDPPTKRAPPNAAASEHSLLSRSTIIGMPSVVTSSWMSPESDTTNQAPESNWVKSKYSSGSIMRMRGCPSSSAAAAAHTADFLCTGNTRQRSGWRSMNSRRARR